MKRKKEIKKLTATLRVLFMNIITGALIAGNYQIGRASCRERV